MANKRIWELTAKTAQTNTDEMVVQQTADGVYRKITRANFLGPVLTGTTASFTTTKDTKLTGIDEGADVTADNETSHADVVQDGDFTTQGIMKRGALAGDYSVITDNSTNWDAAYTHSQAAHAPTNADNTAANETSHADVLVDGDFITAGLMKTDGAGNYSEITDSSTNWDAAYSHSQTTHAPSNADNTAANETSHADVLVDGDFTANGAMERTGAGAYTTILNKRDATAAPNSATDDITLGYVVGSRWIDVTNDKEYVCMDNTDGAAVWQETTGSGGAGSDTTAIHEDTAAEISAITEKASPTTGDWLIIEDGADSNNKKKVDIGNLPTGGGGEINTSSNAGVGGVGIVLPKSTYNLPFKSIAAGSGKITVTDDAINNNVDIDLGSVASTDLSDSANLYRTGGDDVAIADGGTGASTAAAARSNLGLVIGTDVQAHATVLDNTTASFTTTLETKLGTIADNADVTSANETSHADVVVDSDFADDGTMERTGAGTYTTIKNNRVATVAPTTAADTTAGYKVGSRWIDVTADKEYVCLDATAAAAVWTETTQSGGTGGGDLKADGTVPLTANWDVGAFDITAEQFHSDVATGTPPFTVASTTAVANLNADQLDGNEAAAFGLKAGAESISGLWNFISSGLGGLTNYDITIGDVATPDYGIAQIGKAVFGRTSHNTASLDLDGTVVVLNQDTPTTSNILFAMLDSTNSIRFALPKSAVGNATYNPRSMLIAGPTAADDTVVTVGYWQTQGIFHNLACDTSTDGADLGVQNDLEVEGDIFTDSIKESTTAAGVTIDGVLIKDGAIPTIKSCLVIAAGDETTALTVADDKVTFRMPYNYTLTDIRASVTTAPTGSSLIADVDLNGTSIMTTNKLEIEVSEKSTKTATTQPTLTTTALTDDDELQVNINQIGSTVAGAGLKVYLIGYPS